MLDVPCACLRPYLHLGNAFIGPFFISCDVIIKPIPTVLAQPGHGEGVDSFDEDEIDVLKLAPHVLLHEKTATFDAVFDNVVASEEEAQEQLVVGEICQPRTKCDVICFVSVKI